MTWHNRKYKEAGYPTTLEWADKTLEFMGECEKALGLDDTPISGDWAKALFQGKEIKPELPLIEDVKSPPAMAEKKSIFGGLKQ